MSPYQIHTFGCKVNTYDSGLIQKNLLQNPVQLRAGVKVHVLNTCAVTAEATKEATKLIRRIKAKEPFATIVVTGCAAQVDTDFFSNLPGADLIVANSHKGLLPEIIDQFFKGEIKDKVFKSNIFRKEDLEMGGGEEASHTRSFLKIQDGCNSFCTYCIIPYARGKSRSISIQDLTERIQGLSAQGIQEVVLTGVHIGDYEDNGKVLEDLIEALALMHDLHEHDAVIAARQKLEAHVHEGLLRGRDAAAHDVGACLRVPRRHRDPLLEQLGARRLRVVLVARDHLAPRRVRMIGPLVDREHVLPRRDVLDVALARLVARLAEDPLGRP